MQTLTLTAETLVPAPLDKDERIARVKDVLHQHGIFPRRMSGARSVGLTITYAHVQPGDGPRTARLLAESLDWDETSVASITPGSVAITTQRG